MNLTREINALAAELRGPRRDIPCVLAGRNVCGNECCSRVLAASETEYGTCRACHHGQKLARSSGWPVRNLPTLAELPAWAKPAIRPVASTAPVSAAPQPAPKHPAPARAKRVAKSTPKPKATPIQGIEAPAALAVPPAPERLAPRLADLANVLRQLTADGRMRVSMLDIMRGLCAANYDEASSLVQAAKLRTSRLYGPVESVIVDFNAREFLAIAVASEVRQ